MTNEEVIASEDAEEMETEHEEVFDEEVESEEYAADDEDAESDEPAEESAESEDTSAVTDAHDPDHEPGDINGNTWDAPDPYLQAYVATMDSITEASRGGVVDLGGGRRGRGKGGNVNGNRAQPKKKRSSGRSAKGILPPDDPYWQFGMPVEYWGLSVGKAGQYAEGGGQQQGNSKPRGGGNSNSRRNRSGNGAQHADDANGGRKKRRRRRRRGGRRPGSSEGGERSGKDNKSGGNDA